MNERLKQLRKELGLNQGEMSKKLGLNQSIYCKYESGQVKPRESVIKAICSICSVNEVWLKNGKGDMFIDAYEIDMIMKKINQLNQANQDYVMKIIDAMIDHQHFEQDSPTDEGG